MDIVHTLSSLLVPISVVAVLLHLLLARRAHLEHRAQYRALELHHQVVLLHPLLQQQPQHQGQGY
jgi:uncharacterized paraquat-inducible protein A